MGNQRSMVMALYSDFCDANYFHAFESCGQSNKIDVPSMSDNFEALMEKLSGIIWSGITSDENLPGPVRPFTSRFTIHSGRNDSFIIENLRKNHQVDINLLSYTQSDYERFWRTRIETIEMILLDKSGYPIQSIGIEQDEWIGVQVDFPNVFYDKDSLGHEQLFSGQSWNCFADYWSHGDIEDVEHSSFCEVASAFMADKYQPTSNGMFRFSVWNPEVVEMERIAQLRIVFGGTRIGFSGQDELDNY